MHVLIWIFIIIFYSYEWFINRDHNFVYKSLIKVTALVILYYCFPFWLAMLFWFLFMCFVDDKLNKILPSKEMVQVDTVLENIKTPLSTEAKEYLSQHVKELELVAARQRLRDAASDNDLSDEKIQEMELYLKYGPKTQR
jgi:hypothetical protein